MWGVMCLCGKVLCSLEVPMLTYLELLQNKNHFKVMWMEGILDLETNEFLVACS